ncbi:Hypothetical predicted protein [Mytilus galloprovincialis]|uniref:Uncharacterized protein n=1 Tax=Mytilus galloprovincialis TaxID=29158 RepID=A0A8B6GUG9_MYTGA|nr:Hypothetical predicted protein [Mytilus galloprovincialis]
MNKVEDSKRSGAGTCEIYESTWPMYQSVDKFLRTQVRKRVSKSNINSSTTEGDDNADDSGSDLVTPNSSTSSTTAKKRKQMSKDNKSDLLLQKAIDTLNIPEEEDSSDAIFGNYVGTSLSAMPENVNKFILKNKIQNLVCETQILNLNHNTKVRISSKYLEVNPNKCLVNHNKCLVNPNTCQEICNYIQ